jgi:hypothetical protein
MQLIFQHIVDYKGIICTYVLSNPIPCVKTCTVGFVLLSFEGLQNIALILYVQTVV